MEEGYKSTGVEVKMMEGGCCRVQGNMKGEEEVTDGALMGCESWRRASKQMMKL